MRCANILWCKNVPNEMESERRSVTDERGELEERVEGRTTKTGKKKSPGEEMLRGERVLRYLGRVTSITAPALAGSP